LFHVTPSASPAISPSEHDEPSDPEQDREWNELLAWAGLLVPPNVVVATPEDDEWATAIAAAKAVEDEWESVIQRAKLSD
jgi:hypothetical protein